MKQSNELALIKVKKLITIFANGQIPQMHQHEVNPGLDKSGRLNYLYFTLPVAINFQRSSPAMWVAALKTYTDPETNYLFYPEKVVETLFEKVQQDLLKYKLALQKNKHTQIWMAICKVLHEQYSDDPRQIIRGSQNCVVRVKNVLQITKKKDFPYLSGHKMSNYWLYILHNFTDVKLRNLHKISIIPDTHVLQASIVLGISMPKDKPETVAEKWFRLLKGSGIDPIQMHPILWNWSRAGLGRRFNSAKLTYDQIRPTVNRFHQIPRRNYYG